jgi:hypothetical protein
MSKTVLALYVTLTVFVVILMYMMISIISAGEPASDTCSEESSHLIIKEI